MTLLSISNVLDRSALEEVKASLAAGAWRDGRETAGRVARRVKDNEQADLTTPEGTKLRQKLRDAVLQHPVIKAAARPRLISKLMVSRTSGGGHYGPHVDNAFMGKGASRLRTDLSFTLFLSDPKDYESGELIIHSPSGAQEIKLQPGELCLYGTGEIHEVAPVTRGERIVAVGWIESTIADAQQRALLFDLENLRVSLRQSLPAGSLELLTLDKSIANLLRMWGRS